MKRQREDAGVEPNVYYMKLRKRYERYSTSAFGCARKKYPVVIVWHSTNPRARGHKFKDSHAAASYFNMQYYQIHKHITNRIPVEGQCLLNYEKFL